MELSCILEGSALGRKGLMHVLHMNIDVSCILEGSALGRKGLMYVLHITRLWIRCEFVHCGCFTVDSGLYSVFLSAAIFPDDDMARSDS